jgi:hypothetical protein
MNAPKKAAKKTVAPVVIAYKGFDQNLQCRGFQYAVGETYTHDGEVSACNSGFHACEYPLHVLRYYKPGASRFAIVEQSGEISRHDEDTKIASSKITVKAELNLAGLIKAAVKYTTSRAKPVKGSTTTGKNASATASGDSGAATASGNSGAATASGYYGAATASGDYGAATASGDYGAATASGYSGAATASGDYGAATASGHSGKVRGADGCAMFLAERNSSRKIIAVWAGIAGRDGVKPDTWYSLRGGKLVEVSA